MHCLKTNSFDVFQAKKNLFRSFQFNKFKTRKTYKANRFLCLIIGIIDTKPMRPQKTTSGFTDHIYWTIAQ